MFYEIFVRSFFDSDGDGIGDFNGMTAKLDYLNDGDPATDTDLGINGIWLMPIFPSPSYHGYDVTDYQAVNPEFGTMEDFQQSPRPSPPARHPGDYRSAPEPHLERSSLVSGRCQS